MHPKKAWIGEQTATTQQQLTRLSWTVYAMYAKQMHYMQIEKGRASREWKMTVFLILIK